MNELTAHPTKAFALVAATVAAVSLLVSVIRNDERIRTQWARQATALAAVFILVWCAATFLLLVRSPLIAPRLVSAAMLLKTAIGGMGGGILIALFMSGSFLWSRPQDIDKTQ